MERLRFSLLIFCRSATICLLLLGLWYPFFCLTSTIFFRVGLRIFLASLSCSQFRFSPIFTVAENPVLMWPYWVCWAMNSNTWLWGNFSTSAALSTSAVWICHYQLHQACSCVVFCLRPPRLSTGFESSYLHHDRFTVFSGSPSSPAWTRFSLRGFVGSSWAGVLA